MRPKVVNSGRACPVATPSHLPIKIDRIRLSARINKLSLWHCSKPLLEIVCDRWRRNIKPDIHSWLGICAEFSSLHYGSHVDPSDRSVDNERTCKVKMSDLILSNSMAHAEAHSMAGFTA